jgi:hypothetical protein
MKSMRKADAPKISGCWYPKADCFAVAGDAELHGHSATITVDLCICKQLEGVQFADTSPTTTDEDILNKCQMSDLRRRKGVTYGVVLQHNICGWIETTRLKLNEWSCTRANVFVEGRKVAFLIAPATV